tara:strand:+ start:1919 stop:2683 length:765 start_codon:yes stop_codon:yes gene_type:complete
MAQPTTRAEFIQHCLRALGAPVIEINVDTDQISDRVDEAFAFYNAFHDDATEQTYLKHEVTATDIAQGYIPVPNSEFIQDIKTILPPSGYGLGYDEPMFTEEYQAGVAMMSTLVATQGGLADYYITQSYRALYDTIVAGGRTLHFDYNPSSNKCVIHMNWSLVPVGTYFVLDVTRVVDPDTYGDVYSNFYLQKYTAALIKRQWGTNLSKFEGMVMPGGVTFNGLQIFEQANEEIIKLEEEMRLTWELPVDFFQG